MCVGGEAVFSVFDGYMAGVWVERWCSVCLMGWQGVDGQAVFSVFDGVAGCGWRGGVQCV